MSSNKQVFGRVTFDRYLIDLVIRFQAKQASITGRKDDFRQKNDK
jgi:hypothetical protein